VAGNSGTVYTDGIGTQAGFKTPSGIVNTLGNRLVVADTYHHSIRLIAIGSGVTSTIAGNGAVGTQDGQGTNAQFAYPYGLTVDSMGTLYVSSGQGHTIRMIVTVGGVVATVTTIAGSSTSGLVNGFGTNARFSIPGYVAIDTAGRIYVADTGNKRIRLVDTTGACAAGQYGSLSLSCNTTLAGYYKPRISFSDNVYICPNGTYSLAGSSSCTSCPSSSSYGTTSCIFGPSSQPTSQPSGQPSAQPSRQPTGQPTRQPTSQPTRQPTSRPTTQPTRQPTAQPSGRPSGRPSRQPTAQPSSKPTASAVAACLAGTYSYRNKCYIARNGKCGLFYETVAQR
jgi:hypothetical protein